MDINVSIADIFRYYLVWEDKEKNLVEKIKENDEKSFYEYLVYMNVIRNFKKNSTRKILKVAKDYTTKNKNNLDIDEFSNLLFKDGLLAGQNKNAIVAASKILWIFDNKIILFDSRAKKSLKEISGKSVSKYKDYCTAWEEQYKSFKSKYCKQVEENKIEKFSNLFLKDWFIRRTFDNYLWIKQG